MADDKVTVTTVKYHTREGETYNTGDTYEVDASDVGSLVAQGLVTAPEAPAPEPKPSQPVDPMTTGE
jgi:hypothetical protein